MGCRKTCISGGSHPFVRWMSDKLYSRIIKACNNCHGVVGRAIVHDDDFFNVGIGLIEDAPNCVGEDITPIKCGDNDGRRDHGLSSSASGSSFLREGYLHSAAAIYVTPRSGPEG